MTRSNWAWARPLAGAGILAFLLWRLGAGPFLQGLRVINGWALGSAVGIGALTTLCCAWRWSLVARGLGVRLPLRTAVAHCYRSVFLNTTLPGGVLGDVHRAVRHGRDVGDVGRGIRAVVWERSAGQVVQVAVAVVVLFVLPSPVRSYMPAATAVAVTCGLAAVLLAWALPRGDILARVVPRGDILARVVPRSDILARVVPRSGLSRWARAVEASKADIRNGLLARRNWLGIVLASAVVVSGHSATFVIAARTAGATAPLSRLVPLALLALLAMGLPVNVGGWGPREGVAAWAFGAAGLGVAQGTATAVVYGALVLVASLPGACVLVFPRISRVWQVSAVGREGTASGQAAIPPPVCAVGAARQV